MNVSYDPEVEEAAKLTSWLVPLIIGCIVFVGLIGNSLVIFTVCRQKAHRAVTYYYIVNLAVTDLAFLTFCAPFTAAEYALPEWIFGDFLCKFSSFMKQVTGLATCTTLTAMTIDRYRAIVHPFRSLQSRTPRAAVTVSLAIWLVSCFLALPLLFVKHEDEVIFNNVTATVCTKRWPTTQMEKVYNLGTFLAVYPIPLTIISICYAILLQKLWEYSISDRETGNGGQSRARIMRRKRRVTFVILIVVLGFAICWLPLHIFHLWFMIVPPTISKLFIYLRCFSLCLAFSNSAMNPIVYAFVGRKFREQFLYACPCLCKYDVVRQEAMPLDHVVKSKASPTGFESTKRTTMVNSSDNTDPKD